MLHDSHPYPGQATTFDVALPLENLKVTKKLDELGAAPSPRLCHRGPGTPSGIHRGRAAPIEFARANRE